MQILSIFVIVAVFIAITIFFYFIPVGLWVSAIAARVKVPLLSLIGMRLRRIPPKLVVDNMINSTKAGLNLQSDWLETHFLAGGKVTRVVNALIAADKAGINLDFKRATAIDLAGRDVLDAVQTSVNPKVIDCPHQQSENNTYNTIAAVAVDGIQLKVRARVTVRTNIETLVGGATEATIIARVGEGIVSAIGSTATYAAVLGNPDLISKQVLSKGLDAGTAFEILSIDIADIDVGKNIGAELQADQAQADLKVAQARAETRRAMAVAQEQEMKARVQEMRAKVIEKESLVPEAMAAAFRSGNLGIMDFMRIKNIQSDTDMRTFISGDDNQKNEKINP